MMEPLLTVLELLEEEARQIIMAVALEVVTAEAVMDGIFVLEVAAVVMLSVHGTQTQ